MVSIKKSFLWSAIEKLGPQVFGFVLFVVLARLLEPEDFGLVAMLAIFLALAQVFVDSGFSAALIQRKELSIDDETSIFALNVFSSAFVAGLLCLISPLVANFYNQPILTPLLCASSLVLVIGSFGVVQSTLMTRKMLFHKTAIISTTSVAIAGTVGIALAYLDFGVWSLIGMRLSQSTIGTAMYFWMSRWRPRGNFRLQNIRSMWGFSSRLLMCNLIGVVYQNSYAVIIGKIYSAQSLGYFNRANTMRMLPAGVLSGIVGNVSFPLFSKHQDDKIYLLKKMRQIVRSTVLISATGMTLLAVIADPLVPVLLTEKWRPIIPIFRILCLASITYPIHALYLMTLQAQGLSHLNLRLESIKLIVGLGSIALVYRFGIVALAWNVFGLTVFAYFLNARYNVKILGYQWQMQAFDILPSFALVCFVGPTAWVMGAITWDNPIIAICIQVITYVGLSFAGVYLFRRTYFSTAWAQFSWTITRVARRQFL